MEGPYFHTYPQTSFSQCPPVPNPQSSDALPSPQSLQVRGDPEAYQVFPFIRPSDSMYQMAFPCFTPSTLKSDNLRVTTNEDMNLVNVHATHDSRNVHTSTNTSSDQSHHQCALVDAVHSFSASSNFPTIPRAPIAVQSQQQSASRDEPRRSQRKGQAATTLRSHRRRSGIRGGPKRPYSCDICGKAYAQRQGVTRHHREAHQFSVCPYCRKFRWGRPYQLRKHLTEQHPNVDSDAVLGGPIGSRRKVPQISKCSSQRVSSPEHDRRDRDEPRLCPQAPLLSDMTEAMLLSPPHVMSSLDYDSLSRPVEPMNTTQAHENPRDLFLDATYTGAAVSSTEEYTQQANDLETASQSEGIWYRNEGQSVCQDESAAANSQSKPYHLSHPYPLLTDILAAQSSWFLWLNRLDPRILFHSPAQNMIYPGISVP